MQPSQQVFSFIPFEWKRKSSLFFAICPTSCLFSDLDQLSITAFRYTPFYKFPHFLSPSPTQWWGERERGTDLCPMDKKARSQNSIPLRAILYWLTCNPACFHCILHLLQSYFMLNEICTQHNTGFICFRLNYYAFLSVVCLYAIKFCFHS